MITNYTDYTENTEIRKSGLFIGAFLILVKNRVLQLINI